MLLPVPTGQLEVGQFMLKVIDQKHHCLANAPPQQLLQLNLLADRYAVPKVMRAVAGASPAIARKEIEISTAIALLNLPCSCRARELWAVGSCGSRSAAPAVQRS